MGPSVLFMYEIFPPGACGGRSASSVNLGPSRVSETIGATKLRFYMRLDKVKYFFGYDSFSASGHVGGAAPPSVNLRPPHIIIRNY